MNANIATKIFVVMLVGTAVIALPGGLVLAWYYDDGTWAVISVIALIFFMAG